jgi:hypothetical protein
MYWGAGLYKPNKDSNDMREVVIISINTEDDNRLE